MITLPNGDGVDPAVVSYVGYVGRHEGVSGVNPDRVIVRAGVAHVAILCESRDDAIAMRDGIIRQVQRARQHQETRDDVRAQLLREAIERAGKGVAG